jgi:VanZ family protein
METKSNINWLTRWGPAIVWMGAIFYFSATPSSGLPYFGSVDFWVKKSGHFLGYTVLGLTYLWGLGIRKRPAYWMAFVMAIAYAFTDEFHQTFTPGRHPALMDVGIDSSGALLGLGMTYLLYYRRMIFKVNTR